VIKVQKVSREPQGNAPSSIVVAGFRIGSEKRSSSFLHAEGNHNRKRFSACTMVVILNRELNIYRVWALSKGMQEDRRRHEERV
jgi:hypothetical protein